MVYLNSSIMSSSVTCMSCIDTGDRKRSESQASERRKHRTIESLVRSACRTFGSCTTTHARSLSKLSAMYAAAVSRVSPCSFLCEMKNHHTLVLEFQFRKYEMLCTIINRDDWKHTSVYKDGWEILPFYCTIWHEGFAYADMCLSKRRTLTSFALWHKPCSF